MPIYVSECQSCHSRHDYYATVEQRADTPECCGLKTNKLILSPMVSVDNYEYQSPVSGKPIRGKRQRIEDLKRNRCRPWEGLENEKAEAAKVRAAADAKMDAVIDKGVHDVINNMDASKQRVLKTALPS